MRVDAEFTFSTEICNKFIGINAADERSKNLIIENEGFGQCAHESVAGSGTLHNIAWS